MAHGLAVRNIYPETNPTVEPQLQLLVEREPGYRIFFRNLLDMILRRKEPPLFLASQPVHFRKHFHVRTGVHWMVILESIVWHTAAIPLLLVLWTWSLSWEIRHYAVPRSHTMASEQEIYYPLAQAFPAREGRQHEDTPPTRSQPREQALHVAKEQQHESVEAPDVAIGGGANSEVSSSNPTLPAVPLSATARPKLVLPGDLAEAIGPAPDGGQLAIRGVSGLATASVVAPPPQIARAGRGGMLSAPVMVIAPAPALQGSLGWRRMSGGELGSGGAVAPMPSLPLSQPRAGHGAGNGTLAASGLAVVPPAPSVRGRVYRAGGAGELIGGTGTQVVAPSPSLGHALMLAGGHGNSLAGAGEQVVPPTPSIRGRSYLAGNGGSAIGGTGASVVAPSPILGNTLVGDGRGRGNALGDGIATGVVPPAPAIAGSGGRGSRGGRIQSFGDGNGSAIAPLPALGRLPVRGGMGGNGVGSLNGNGEQIVGPAPSLGGTGLGSSGAGMGDGGKSLVASLGTQSVAPPGMGSSGLGAGMGTGNGTGGAGPTGSSGSVQGSGLGGGSGSGSAGGGTEVAGLGPSLTGNGGGAVSGTAPIISSAVPSQAQVPDIPAGKTEVVPLRVIQLALALPMSSYFSNYEAFIAERSVNRNTQLIKLVYIFLPYQRRLTEFGIKPAKTFNLRVTRDPSCDESLLSMTWPEGERGQPPAEQAKDKLPCYRTTADDYRRAWEKAR